MLLRPSAAELTCCRILRGTVLLARVQALAIPVCTTVLTLLLALVMNLFWRAFYMVKGK